jgi:hypothetical protein
MVTTALEVGDVVILKNGETVALLDRYTQPSGSWMTTGSAAFENEHIGVEDQRIITLKWRPSIGDEVRVDALSKQKSYYLMLRSDKDPSMWVVNGHSQPVRFCDMVVINMRTVIYSGMNLSSHCPRCAGGFTAFWPSGAVCPRCGFPGMRDKAEVLS